MKYETNKTIYKSLKIVNNTLNLNGTKLYTFASDILTHNTLSAHANAIKNNMKLDKHIKRILSNIIKIEVNDISPTYKQITILYPANEFDGDIRTFTKVIDIDTWNGLRINW